MSEMSTPDLIVIITTVLLSAGLLWFFFGPRRPAEHAQRDGDGHTQQVTVVVRGGYTPDRIEAMAGVPLQITFDRQETGDCTSRVVFPELGIT